MGPLIVLDVLSRRRRRAFEEEVPDALLMMANSLRAGQAFEQALSVVAAEGPDPMAQEFRRLLSQQRLGIAPEDTLRTLAERMQSEAFDWIVMATIIQRQVGGNLAEVYEKIAETLRERARLQREVKTLTAEGRISAIILLALPLGLGAFTGLFTPDYASLLYTTKPGQIMVALALVAMLLGGMWIRRIVRVDV